MLSGGDIFNMWAPGLFRYNGVKAEPGFTSEKLLLVVQAVSLYGGQLVLVLLDYFLQRAVQILLLLLEELLFLDSEEHRWFLNKGHFCTNINKQGRPSEVR